MNNKRRKELRSISSGIDELRNRLDAVIGEEQDAYDNMPEGVQDSDKGTTMVDAIDTMEDILNTMGELTDAIDEVVNM